MKKSSQARIEKRIAKKKFKKENKNMLENNKCWDELEMLHAGVVGLLYSTKNITPLLRDENIMKRIDAKEAAKISQIIANDLLYYKDKIETIHNQHTGKTGGSDDPDVLFESIMIGQQYMELTESFNMVVRPNIDRILNMANDIADQIKAEENAREAASDNERGLTEVTTPADESPYIEVNDKAPEEVANNE